MKLVKLMGVLAGIAAALVQARAQESASPVQPTRASLASLASSADNEVLACPTGIEPVTLSLEG